MHQHQSLDELEARWVHLFQTRVRPRRDGPQTIVGRLCVWLCLLETEESSYGYGHRREALSVDLCR